MRKSTLMALAVGTALCVGAVAVPRAEAMTAGTPAGLGVAADGFDATETVQYAYGGRNYCWYPAGWKGPGWYWCGYAARRGYGWGGPAGWRGWTYGAPPVVRRPPPPVYHRGPPPRVHRGPPPPVHRGPPPRRPGVYVR